MPFTRQTTLIVSHFQPGWVPPPGVTTPYDTTPEDTMAYAEQMDQWILEGKTDGVQHSDEVGTSIRKWIDQDAAQAYIDYTLNSIVWPYNVPAEEVNYFISPIPGSEE